MTMDILLILVLVGVAGAFTYMALDAARWAK